MRKDLPRFVCKRDGRIVPFRSERIVQTVVLLFGDEASKSGSPAFDVSLSIADDISETFIGKIPRTSEILESIVEGLESFDRHDLVQILHDRCRRLREKSAQISILAGNSRGIPGLEYSENGKRQKWDKGRYSVALAELADIPIENAMDAARNVQEKIIELGIHNVSPELVAELTRLSHNDAGKKLSAVIRSNRDKLRTHILRVPLSIQHLLSTGSILPATNLKYPRLTHLEMPIERIMAEGLFSDDNSSREATTKLDPMLRLFSRTSFAARRISSSLHVPDLNNALINESPQDITDKCRSYTTEIPGMRSLANVTFGFEDSQLDIVPTASALLHAFAGLKRKPTLGFVKNTDLWKVLAYFLTSSKAPPAGLSVSLSDRRFRCSIVARVGLSVPHLLLCETAETEKLLAEVPIAAIHYLKAVSRAISKRYERAGYFGKQMPDFEEMSFEIVLAGLDELTRFKTDSGMLDNGTGTEFAEKALKRLISSMIQTAENEDASVKISLYAPLGVRGKAALFDTRRRPLISVIGTSGPYSNPFELCHIPSASELKAVARLGRIVDNRLTVRILSGSEEELIRTVDVLRNEEISNFRIISGGG